jgi:hypothetical protein
MGMPSACHGTLKRGDEIELAIDTVAFGGAGIGRYGERVGFTVSMQRATRSAMPMKSIHGSSRSAPEGTTNVFTTPTGSRAKTIINGICPFGAIRSLETSLPWGLESSF